MSRIIRSGSDWTTDDLYWMNEEIEKCAAEISGVSSLIQPGGFSIYENQVEIITAEQMLDAYTSIGMPVFYNHWSFGKNFLRDKQNYIAGYSGLAYEIVINSNPCIVYIMENNTMAMQALVLAHAGIGHNHFFKNNYLFKARTNAKNIIDYLVFARKYIGKCEEKYGVSEVEKVLDACHALQSNSVFRYQRKEPLSLEQEMQRKLNKAIKEQEEYNIIWETLPVSSKKSKTSKKDKNRKDKLHLPEENLLYFIETYAPKMPQWKREICRICRNIAEYFYPQGQTKVMNEGCATWTHYEIMNKLHEKGFMDNGAQIEWLMSHSSVVYQPNFNSKYFTGFNPYSLGWNMMKDIVRICNEPTEEDKEWFPLFAGCKDSWNVLNDAWGNYRDESFVRQFLSPKLIRQYKMFALDSIVGAPTHVVQAIHDERGYREIREILADDYDIGRAIPEINIVDCDLEEHRHLKLEFCTTGNRHLDMSDARICMQHIANLWGYGVRINFTTADGGYIDHIYEEPENPDQDSDEHVLDQIVW